MYLIGGGKMERDQMKTMVIGFGLMFFAVLAGPQLIRMAVEFHTIAQVLAH